MYKARSCASVYEDLLVGGQDCTFADTTGDSKSKNCFAFAPHTKAAPHRGCVLREETHCFGDSKGVTENNAGKLLTGKMLLDVKSMTHKKMPTQAMKTAFAKSDNYCCRSTTRNLKKTLVCGKPAPVRFVFGQLT